MDLDIPETEQLFERFPATDQTMAARFAVPPAPPPPDYTCASLRPVNIARQILYSAIPALAENDDLVHLRFYCVNDQPETLDIGLNPLQKLVQQEMQGGQPVQQQQEQQQEREGNLFFSFSDLDPSDINAGWIVGRSINSDEDSTKEAVNDMQLSAKDDKRARHVNVDHAAFQIDRGTGLFAITVSPDKNHKTFWWIDGVRKELVPGSTNLLCSQVTRLEFGDLEYQFVYEAPRIDKELFLQSRKNYIERVSGHAFRPYPGGFDMWWPTFPPPLGMRWGVRLKQTIGQGGYGWVTSGIDIATGALVAVKEFECVSAKERLIPAVEFQAARSLAWSSHLVTLLRLECEHAHPQPANCVQECKTVIIFPLAYGSFLKLAPGILAEDPRDLWRLFHSSLKGLRTIHFYGYIHRDISAKNQVVTEFDGPNGPEGSIIDMGAMINAISCTEVFSPVSLQPPEANPEGPSLITNKADIWSFARSMVTILGYEEEHPAWAGKNWPTRAHYQHLLKFVRDQKSRHPAIQLYDLLARMLAINPDERPTAQQALDDRSWWTDMPHLEVMLKNRPKRK